MIIKTNSFLSITQHTDEKTLLIVDIDNTLVNSQTYYGSVNWEMDLYESLIKEGFSHKKAKTYTQNHWYEAQKSVSLSPIEKGIQTFLKTYLLKNNLIAITARDRTVMDLTFKSLKNLDFHFSLVDTPLHCSLTTKTPIPAYLHYGILFCGDCPKSIALFYLIETLNLLEMPKKIVMVDDTEHNLEDMHKKTQKHGINFIGLHYNGARPLYQTQPINNIERSDVSPKNTTTQNLIKSQA